MLIVPLNPVNNQYLSVSLANQPVQLVITQRSTGLFTDIYLNNALLLGGVLGRNAVRMIRDLYFGFAGDFAFYDTQGEDDPYYTGLGSRYQLVYLTPADLGGIG